MNQNLVPNEFDDLNENKNPFSFFTPEEGSNAPKSFSFLFNNNNSNQEDSSWNNHDHYYINNNQNGDLLNNQVIQNVNNNQEVVAENNRASNNINNGDDNGNDNTKNTKCLFKVVNNQQLDNKTTRFTTNITNANNHIEKIENQKEEDKKEEDKKEEDKKEKEIKDNTKQDSTYGERNFPNVFMRNFLDRLIDFINELIKISNKEKKTSIEPLLKNFDKMYYIKQSAKERLAMLTKKAFEYLNLDPNVIKEKDKDSIFIYFIERLQKIHRDPENKDINSVLNLTIQELLDIYREKVEPKEEFYIHFKRFKDHYNNINKGEEYKEILKKVGEQFEERINKLYDNDHKRGRKPDE